MKELKKTISVSLPPIRLYLDDVQRIYDILKKNCERIDIKTDKYEFNDVSDLEKLKATKIHKLDFSCYTPYISIGFNTSSARIYIGEDTTLNRGVLSEINEVLSNCRRNVVRLFIKSNPSFYLTSVAIILSILAYEHTQGWVAGALIAIIVASAVSLVYTIGERPFTNILQLCYVSETNRQVSLNETATT